MPQDGACQRMFGSLLEAGSQGEGFVRGMRQGQQIGHHGLAARQSARLVDRQHTDFFRTLERLGIFDQDAGTAPCPVPTMIAVGVASPSAHGQAMTSTATALTSASC
jgi:hypothetical protein